MKNIELKVILELIELKFGRGSSKNWINRDFEELSFEISKATKTPISSHTLKRIFGKLKTDEYYLPQKATFIALKQYCNFDNAQRIKTESEINIKTSDAPKKKQKISKKHKFIVVIAVFVSLATFIYFFISNITDPTFNGRIRLISTEGQIPTSAQFEYSTPNNKDSFSICYDPNFEAIEVPNGKNLKSNYYYQYPGLFKVRMWQEDKIVSQRIPVYIQSKGWEAFSSYTTKKQFDRFYQLNLKKCIQNSVFSPTKNVLFNAGIDTTRLAEVMLHNYYPTTIDGDNFRLETTLKNSDEWIGSTCNSVFLIIAGRKEYIQFHFANPGCSYWIHCRISEKKIDKSNENLKNLTFDMSKWQHFDIQNKNKQINISVNNKLRFSCSYRKSIGEIMGVTVRFQGNGYLKEYKLSDLTGNKVLRL